MPLLRWPFRVEDVLLAGWNAAGVPLVATVGLAPILELSGEANPIAGIVQLVAVVGAITAFATRTSEPALTDSRRLGGVGGEVRLAFMGPMVGGVAFVAGAAADHLGLAGIDEPVVGIAFLTIVAAAVFGDHLPVAPVGVRRALVAPFIFVSAGIFNQFAADILAGVDLIQLTSASLAEGGGFGLFILFMLVGGLAAFYAALVVAPRQLVEPERGWAAWPLRFALFLVSAAFGIGWLAVAAS